MMDVSIVYTDKLLVNCTMNTPNTVKSTPPSPTIASTPNKQSIHPTTYIHSLSAPTSPHTEPRVPHNTPTNTSNVNRNNNNKSMKRKHGSVNFAFSDIVKSTRLYTHTHTSSYVICIFHCIILLMYCTSATVSAQSTSVLSGLVSAGSTLGSALGSALGVSPSLTSGLNTASSDLSSLVNGASALNQLGGGSSTGIGGLPNISSVLPSTPSVPVFGSTNNPLSGLTNVNSIFDTPITNNYTAIYQSQVSVIDSNDPSVWRIIFIAQQPLYQVVLHYAVQQLSSQSQLSILPPSSTQSLPVQYSTLQSGATQTLDMITAAAKSTGGTFFGALGSIIPIFTSSATTLNGWTNYLNSLNQTAPQFNSLTNMTQQYNYIMNNLTSIPSQQFVHNFIVYQPWMNQQLYYRFDVQQLSTSAIQTTPWIVFTGNQPSVNTTQLLLQQQQDGTAACMQ